MSRETQSWRQFVQESDCLHYVKRHSFDNVFEFLDFCKKRSLDDSNSLTYWAVELQRMFISY